jgi:hypothetical protein
MGRYSINGTFLGF